MEMIVRFLFMHLYVKKKQSLSHYYVSMLAKI